MINISNCPITGYKRKITGKVFIWDDISRRIGLRCFISYFDQNDVELVAKGISPFEKDLMATDSGKVNPSNGDILTQEQIDDPNLGFTPMSEYEYYRQMAFAPVTLNNQILGVIALRDSQGKFNI